MAHKPPEDLRVFLDLKKIQEQLGGKWDGILATSATVILVGVNDICLEYGFTVRELAHHLGDAKALESWEKQLKIRRNVGFASPQIELAYYEEAMLLIKALAFLRLLDTALVAHAKANKSDKIADVYNTVKFKPVLFWVSCDRDWDQFRREHGTQVDKLVSGLNGIASPRHGREGRPDLFNDLSKQMRTCEEVARAASRLLTVNGYDFRHQTAQCDGNGALRRVTSAARYPAKPIVYRTM